MRVCVIGMGYIGFPTACIIAGAGHDVTGVDVNQEIVSLFKNGGLHIENEKGLYELNKKVMQSGKLKVQSTPEKADIFIIAVPTPCRKSAVGEAKKADLSYVEKASNDILPYLQKGNLVVLESTVPTGTTEDVVGPILERGGFKVGEDIHLAFAPERVLPGRIMIELTGNDRIIGGVTREAAEKARDFYATFVSGKIHLCNARTAEMAKLIENTYRDVNIALANELALLAEKAEVNSYEAIDLANNHPRVNVLKPGPGVGGHCIAEDPYFLIEISNELSPLLQLARQINMGMPLHVVKLFKILDEKYDIKKVSILGVSYKANVGDARNSPGLQVAERIRAQGKEVVIHDPYIKEYGHELVEVLSGSDLMIIITDHDYYREKLEPEEVGVIMNNRLAIDTRGFLDESWDKHFKVIRLGVG